MDHTRHIEPSEVRCTVTDDLTWRQLIANPELAARVEKVAITDSGTDNGETWKRVQRQSELLIIQAIHNTKNLESFTWDCRGPYVSQGDEVPGQAQHTYREDIWTALRDHTPLQSLMVVDYGRGHGHPIFESTLFTLRNLVHLHLELFIVTKRAIPGSGNGSDSDEHDYDSDDHIVPPCVSLAGIQYLVNSCRLETFALILKDEKEYSFPGHPFVDVSALIMHCPMPFLTTLCLRNVTVDAHVIIPFFQCHQALRAVTATLAFEHDYLPHTPFKFDSRQNLPDDLLPGLESLLLPPHDLRMVLRAMYRPCNLSDVGILDPAHWNASQELENDYNYVTVLDDVWGIPLDDIHYDDGQRTVRGRDLENLLTGIPQLRRVEVQNVQTRLQLQKLIRSTPLLEHVVFHDSFSSNQLSSQETKVNLHTQCLSHWPNLLSISGNIIWTHEPGIILTALKDMAKACPLLQSVTWNSGSATLTRISGQLSIRVFENLNPQSHHF